MMGNRNKTTFKFYFITDDHAPHLSPLDQVQIAISAGATIVQYRCKSFAPGDYHMAATIGDLCHQHQVSFLINDDVLLAKALGADGVHLGQEDTAPGLARHILGVDSIIGLSVSNLKELQNSDLTDCDYIGTGPAFVTRTKLDAKPVRGPTGLARIAELSPLPMVAIGGITADTVASCFRVGADGVAVSSYITRAADPLRNALEFGKACGCPPRDMVLNG